MRLTRRTLSPSSCVPFLAVSRPPSMSRITIDCFCSFMLHITPFCMRDAFIDHQILSQVFDKWLRLGYTVRDLEVGRSIAIVVSASRATAVEEPTGNSLRSSNPSLLQSRLSALGVLFGWRRLRMSRWIPEVYPIRSSRSVFHHPSWIDCGIGLFVGSAGIVATACV